MLVCLSLGAGTGSAAGLPTTLVKDGFTEPLYVTNAGDARLFVVEQGGMIKIIHPDQSVTTFLDLTSIVAQSDYRGLLSMAFHPNYATNGLFYVDYTREDVNEVEIAEYHVSAGDPDVADPASARIVLDIPRPNTDHDGGWMGFRGKLLFITVGDGHSLPGDALGLAQDKNSLNGKILRIDPRDPDGTGPLTHSVPAGNRYVGKDGLDEIWSLGLRNTFRCSFDRLTGKLWCGDVGEDLYEEIDRVKVRASGYNFGWNLIEGFHDFTVGSTDEPLCTTRCKTLPIAEYTHASNPPCAAVMGGYVSRRQGAALYGKYLFADVCTGKVWVIPADFKAGKALPAPVADTAFSSTSFGEGADGRLYIVDRMGAIYLLDQS
jgi:glucose/arabinose dehydrogenase